MGDSLVSAKVKVGVVVNIGADGVPGSVSKDSSKPHEERGGIALNRQQLCHNLIASGFLRYRRDQLMSVREARPAGLELARSRVRISLGSAEKLSCLLEAGVRLLKLSKRCARTHFRHR